MSNGGWIGVDLDGTLASYGEWKGPKHIGDPVPKMLDRVKLWIAQGKDVRIFTARVSGPRADVLAVDETIECIDNWCLMHIGHKLPITCTKDYGMVELWDDRAIQVKMNTGERVDGK